MAPANYVVVMGDYEKVFYNDLDKLFVLGRISYIYLDCSIILSWKNRKMLRHKQKSAVRRQKQLAVNEIFYYENYEQNCENE